MFKYIPRIFIHDLLSRTDIVNLINIRIKLKQRGENFYAYCPFHNENTPSFTVSKEKQFYYCFGCGAHGNVIDFLMNHDRLNFIESITELASQNNMKFPYDGNHININNQIYYLRKNLYSLMDKLNTFYHHMLHTKLFTLANDYLKKRGLNQSIITYFSIGFAPPGWNTIQKQFGYEDNTNIMLNNVGMLVKNHNNNTYDRFRKRIMFPIRDVYGHIIAFGGRLIDDGEPKYINSPETKIFHKGRQVYGLYEAKKQNRELPCLLVVEGYMDVISLSQFGIHYAVATLGTSVTKEHVQLLYRYTDHLICCYDGDQAGQQAAWRTLKVALFYLTDNKQLSFMFLPKGKDPDILIRQIGKNKFEMLIKQALPLSIFLFKILSNKVDLNNLDSRPKLAILALSLINKIPSKILRLYLRQQLGIRLGIFDDNKLNKLVFLKNIKTNNLLPIKIKYNIMHILIGLLIQYPQLFMLVSKLPDPSQLKLSDVQLFIELVQICKNQPDITTAQLLECYRNNKFYSKLETLATWNHMIANEAIKNTFIDTLNSLHYASLEYKQETLIAHDRLYGLNPLERQELWSINKILSKKCKINF